MRAIYALIVGSVLAASSPAIAQETIVEGTGYKIGEGTVFHPTVGVEAGTTSNVFFEEEEKGPIDSAVLRLVGAVAIASRPAERLESSGDSGAPQKLEFRFGARLVYEDYITSNEAAKAQSNLAGSLEAKVKFFPEGNVRFGIDESFERHTRPVNFESSASLDRNINELKLTLGWHPAGRTLSGGLRYENMLDRFESNTSAFANRIQHTVGVRSSWQYLPVTKFYLDASWGFYGQLGDDTVMGQAFKSDANPLRVVVGGASALTERTTLRLHAGWAVGFYDAGATYNSPIYGAEFGLRYSPLGRFTLQVDRTFQDSINANFYSEYSLRATIEQQISRALLRTRASVQQRSYQGVPGAVMPVGGATTRDDLLASIEVEGSYHFRDWLAVLLSYTLALDETDFTYMVDSTTVDDPSYIRHDLSASVFAAF